MILIIGATGALGTKVITELLKKISPSEIAVYTRKEQKAEKWRAEGISVRTGDFSDKGSQIRAYQGIERLLFIPPAQPGVLSDFNNVVDAAVECEVKHLYFASQALNANISESKLGIFGDSYHYIENNIKKSGLEYTIFQNGLHAEIVPFFIGQFLPINGINFPSGQGKSTFVTRDDLGEAMAVSMVESKMKAL